MGGRDKALRRRGLNALERVARLWRVVYWLRVAPAIKLECGRRA
jgi:hypothetical protein